MNRIVLAALLALGGAFPAAADAAARAGQPAPPLSLPTVDGTVLTLASLRGKAVYLNFYATWCPPCNQEAPAVGRLSAKFKGRGLVVVGVNEMEDPQKAKSFLTKYHLPYTAVVDSAGTVAHDYGALGLPVHVFIDRNGIIKSLRFGEMNEAEIEMAINAII